MNYKLDNTSVASFGAFPVLSGERIAVSGIFDCPKRKSPTERSWDTEVEPFTQAQDIKLEGREISLVFGMLKTGDLEAFKTALVACAILTVENIPFDVLCRFEIEVSESGDYYRLRVRYWHDAPVLPEISITPSGTGKIMLDNYNLHNDFGIHGNADGGFYSVGPRLEVNMTETYSKTQYRDFRELTINCFMLGSSFADLYSKMSQFQALLYSPGMRTLVINADTAEANSYSCYCKAGFKAQVVAENLLKFTLKLSTND